MWRRAALVATCLLMAPRARAEAGTLTCIEQPSTGVYQTCTDTGTLAVGANVTYYFPVSEASVSDQTFDLNITLTSLTGDSDL